MPKLSHLKLGDVDICVMPNYEELRASKLGTSLSSKDC